MHNTLPDITIVGSANQDISCFVRSLPLPGETVMATSKKGFGGKGANQCVMAAKLSPGSGLSVGFVGALGDDAIGKDTIQNFQANNVNVDFVKRFEGKDSGYAFICIDSTGENSIVVVPGANMEVKKVFVDEALSRAELPALTIPSIILCQLEVCNSGTLAALEYASRMSTPSTGRSQYPKRVLAFLTPAPVPEGGLPSGMSEHVDVLVCNAIEASTLAKTGSVTSEIQEKLKQFVKQSSNTAGVSASSTLVDEIKALVRALHIPSMIITLGATGAVVVTSNYVRTSTDREFDVDIVPVSGVVPDKPIVDTTGAGDAFCGSVAFFYLYLLKRAMEVGSPNFVDTNAVICSKTLVEAVKRATHVAAITVTAEGTQSSYPARDILPDDLFK